MAWPGSATPRCWCSASPSAPGAANWPPLDITDLSFTPEGVQVEVRTSKTDRDSRGRTAALPYGAHSVT
jgi:hypothetical protein